MFKFVNKTKIILAVALGGFLCIFQVLRVFAAEGDTGHLHSGDSINGGGCYSIYVPHIHSGNNDCEGGCYTKKVYHVHDGDSTRKGGCYTIPVYQDRKSVV